jgi:hypothetical protein
MKTKLVLLSTVLAGAFIVPAFAAGRGNGNGNGNGNRNAGGPGCPANPSGICDLSGPGQGTPLRDGSGRMRNGRGNPNSNGTPLRDGSGKATAPGKGPKDGSGNRANCPNVPKG